MADSKIHTLRGYVVTRPDPPDVSSLNTLCAYVVTRPASADVSSVNTLRAYVVTEPAARDVSNITGVRAYVVTAAPDTGGLAQVDPAARPAYVVVNGTPYVEFEPGATAKQLWFYPEVTGRHEIIALRPDLATFFEQPQVFSGPAQLEVPHFNQVLVTSSTLSETERSQIRTDMLARASGTGINIDYVETEALSLTNPGAETQDMTGWTTSGGFTTRTGAAGETPGAYEGTHYFYGGSATAGSSASQDVDVSGYSAQIDAGNVALLISWQQSHYSGNDEGNIQVEFLDASKALIGIDLGPGASAHTGGWDHRRAGPTVMPVNTRTARILMKAKRYAGSNNDAYFDDLKAAVFFPGANAVSGGLKDPYIPGVLETLPEATTTLSPTWAPAGYTMLNGNLTALNSSGGANYRQWVPATKVILSNLTSVVYWEVVVQATRTGPVNGYMSVHPAGLLDDAIYGYDAGRNSVDATGSIGYRGDGSIWVSGSEQVTAVEPYGNGDIVMFAFEPSSGSVWVGKNGVWANDPSAAATCVTQDPDPRGWVPTVQGRDDGDGATLRAEALQFAYPIPSGAVAYGAV